MARIPAPHPELDARAADRAAGVLLGAAVGDALGVPYEFKATLREDQRPMMIGGGLGPYEPGEYSDDTQMQVCIAQVAATGADLRDPEALDAIAANFQHWLGEGASDVGNQTSMILSIAARAPGSAGTAMREAAREYTARNARSAGNGSLMRTGIVALAHLGDPAAMAEAAIAVSALTHPDPDCADACVLWCSGIRTAVLDGTFDGVRRRPELPARRTPGHVGGAVGRGRGPPTAPLHQQRLGRPRTPGRLVGDHPYRRAGVASLRGQFSRPAPSVGPGGGGACRNGHRHRRGDRRCPARRALGQFRCPAGVAAGRNRLARPEGGRSGPAGTAHRPRRQRRHHAADPRRRSCRPPTPASPYPTRTTPG